MSAEESRPDNVEAAHMQAGDLAPIVDEWAQVYECADRWVRWTARRRWPAFAVNDQIWACSVADWETSGRRAA